jgi:glycerol uptake facilitator-like aquaporin
MASALSQHWPEYLMEAGGLGLFMVSACSFGAALQLPGSPVVRAIMNPTGRRVLMGLAMGVTAIALVYSPIGKQSGGHFNPSVTLTFLRLKKIEAWDAFFYVIFQFIGGIAGVAIAAALLGPRVADPNVNYVVTVPGPTGAAPALIAEFAMAFVLMSVILHSSNHVRYSIAGGAVYQRPGAGLRYEYEPGTDDRLRNRRALVDGRVDLFHRSAARNAGSRRALPDAQGNRVLRQALPPQPQALHLPLPFH